MIRILVFVLLVSASRTFFFSHISAVKLNYTFAHYTKNPIPKRSQLTYEIRYTLRHMNFRRKIVCKGLVKSVDASVRQQANALNPLIHYIGKDFFFPLAVGKSLRNATSLILMRIIRAELLIGIMNIYMSHGD